MLWALGDNLGTIRDIADLSGSTTSVTNHRRFGAYGNLVSESNSAVDMLFAYTGKLYDENTQLQNNLFRWYDASIGQWMCEDPLGFIAGDTNLKRYVGNQSTNLVDSHGLQPPADNPSDVIAKILDLPMLQQMDVNGGEVVISVDDFSKAVMEKVEDMLKKAAQSKATDVFKNFPKTDLYKNLGLEDPLVMGATVLPASLMVLTAVNDPKDLADVITKLEDEMGRIHKVDINHLTLPPLKWKDTSLHSTLNLDDRNVIKTMDITASIPVFNGMLDITKELGGSDAVRLMTSQTFGDWNLGFSSTLFSAAPVVFNAVAPLKIDKIQGDIKMEASTGDTFLSTQITLIPQN